MMMMTTMTRISILLLLFIVDSTECFQSAAQQLPNHPTTTTTTTTRRTRTVLFDATGGWGIGSSRDMVPEEFARGDRKAFEGYELTDRGEFMRQVKRDKDDLMKGEVDELLAVAKMAGIHVKNPAERLDKFEPDLFDDDDELDLSVPPAAVWEEADPFDYNKAKERNLDDSVTRMDEDTGALGTW